MNKAQLTMKKTLIGATIGSLLTIGSANAFMKTNQVDTVGNLLLKSSAAKKVQSSDNSEAKALYQETKAIYEKAQNASDPEEIKSLLDQVVKNMVKVGKLADGGEAVGEKLKHDFEKRLESIKALLTAQETVANEKSDNDAAKVRQTVNALVADAQSQYQVADYKHGRDILDQAYELLKTSIEQMRGGDVLVNSLNFATPEEEFAYYQTKTSSQLKALNMFQARATKESKQRMLASIDKAARKFIEDATALEQQGEHDEAVKLMERALTRLQSGLMMAFN